MFILLLLVSLTHQLGSSYDNQISIIESSQMTSKKQDAKNWNPEWVDPFDISVNNYENKKKGSSPKSISKHQDAKVRFDGKKWNPEWVDPFDMSVNKYETKKKGSSPKSISKNQDTKVKLDVEDWNPEWVDQVEGNIINYESDWIDPFDMSVTYKSADSSRDLKLPKQFQNTADTTKPLKHKAYSSFRFSFYEKTLKGLKNNMMEFFSSPEKFIITICVLLFGSVMWAIFISRSYRFAFVAFFIAIFMAGYGFNWMRMYQEKEIESYYDFIKHGLAPYHCKGNILAWYENIFYRIFGDDCLEFYKRRDTKPFLKVSPMDVLSVTVASMILEPSFKIGQSVGQFIIGIISPLPWYGQILAIPITMFSTFLFGLLLVSLLFNYHLRFSPVGISLEPPRPDNQTDRYIRLFHDKPHNENSLLEYLRSAVAEQNQNVSRLVENTVENPQICQCNNTSSSCSDQQKIECNRDLVKTSENKQGLIGNLKTFISEPKNFNFLSKYKSVIKSIVPDNLDLTVPQECKSDGTSNGTDCVDDEEVEYKVLSGSCLCEPCQTKIDTEKSSKLVINNEVLSGSCLCEPCQTKINTEKSSKLVINNEVLSGSCLCEPCQTKIDTEKSSKLVK